MVNYLKKILDLLSPAERRRGYLLLGMITMMALLEVAGVASIMPFMAVLANPGVVETNPYLNAAYAALGFENTSSFLLFLGFAVFAILVLSISFKALTTYALLCFSHMRNYTLSKRLVSSYLHQPYEWFLSRHSADLGKTVLSEAQLVIDGALIPIMQLIANGAVAVALVLILVLVDPLLAVLVALGIGGAYAGIYFALRGYLNRIGEDRVKANRERYQVIQEAFGGIKDIKFSALEGTMLHRFDDPAKRFASRRVGSQVVAQLPRYVLEIVSFGGILAVVLYLMANRGGLQQALPVIALYAFAGYRLMPALQQIYAHLSKMRFNSAALDTLHQDLISLNPHTQATPAKERPEPMRLRRAIRLETISYTYPGAATPALRDLSLDIPARTTVGLVGATGSGKTTTVDIILGLLQPQQGNITIDDLPLYDSDERSTHNPEHRTQKVERRTPSVERLRPWQRNLGYVPQHIYLADDTVAANIAFGIPPHEIDQEAVERAARIAELHEFVVSELPQGYNTMVGERGVRLSGGQRQRIGIARALYHDPEVLIFDEATSALDNLTEQAVMEAVHNLGHKKTIILIAHRLSTVRECDRIYLLKRGQVAGQGTYAELVAQNDHFRSLAQVAAVKAGKDQAETI